MPSAKREASKCAHCGAPTRASTTCARCASRAKERTQDVAGAATESVESAPTTIEAPPSSSAGPLARSSTGKGKGGAAAAPEKIGKYRIDGELGRGGMGVVYRAFDTKLGREVALKVILDPALAGDAVLRRFRREASAAGRLRHPGIVSVYEIGETEGRPFIVMELVRGENLEKLLARGKLPWERVARVVRQVALALDHAHENGIVHRDVKPENVVVEDGDTARLMDFGLAREIDDSEKLTVSGQVLGTPIYMAPEQTQGDSGSHGPHTDVYALGGILYRALAGRPPFVAKSVQKLLARIQTETPRPPSTLDPGVPRDLEAIALRCLAKDPGRRPSAAAVAEDLERFERGVAVLSRAPGRLEHAESWTRRNKALAVVLLGTLVLAVASPIVWFALERSAEARLEAEREKNQRAEREAAAAAEENHRRALALIAEAETLYGAHDYAGAAEKASRALDLGNGIQRAWYIRAIARREAGDGKGALADVARAIELDGRDGRSFALRGDIEKETGDDESALRDWSRALELDPSDAKTWRNRAFARERKGAFEGAVADASRALELAPRDAQAWLARGYARAQLGEAEGALSDLTRSVELDPKLADAWKTRGNVRQQRGELQLALADYVRAIELDPKSGYARLNRGMLEDELGDFDSALADLDVAVEQLPGLHQAWLERGTTRQHRREYEASIADLTRALELDPRSIPALNTRGSTHVLKGDKESALADFTRAIEIDPRTPEARFNRGVTRKSLGDRDGAIEDLERFLEVAPGHKLAGRARELLDALREGR